MSLFTSAKTVLITGAAALTFAVAAPAASAHDFDNISINGFNFDFDSEDLLQSLIEMDAEDIAEMRADLAEARVEIRDAIGEIADARAEADKNEELKPIILAALAEASKEVEGSVGEAFAEVRTELDRAESELSDLRSSLDEAEFNETKDLIAFLRSELVEFEVAVGELVAAMKA
jgi:chromosome segregation ATPase